MAKKKTNQKARRRRNLNEQLPEFIHGACEFSDDDDLGDALFTIEEINKQLTSGVGKLGSLWSEMQAEYRALTRKKEGRKRIEGDWPLLYLSFVLSKEPEMMEFWRKKAYRLLWEEAGFDKKPTYATLWNRFTELERPELLALWTKIADAVVGNAMRHDDKIGQVVHIDFSGFHSRAIPHHACTDPETCPHNKDGVTQDIQTATPREVASRRHEEAKEAPEIGLRHPDAPEVIAIRPNAGRGKYKRIVKIGGHLCGLHDASAGARAYFNPDGSLKEFWVGGYEGIVVDGRYGAKLASISAPADRQEYNLYFPLMRKLEKTTGFWPEAVTGDRGLAINKVFRFNTRHGIGSIFPFRKTSAIDSREEMRSVRIDEHGVVRCEHCGSECSQESFEFRGSESTERPVFLVKCILGLSDECRGKRQTADPEKIVPRSEAGGVPMGWRLLLPIPRTTELYHALKGAHRNMEHVFRHQRQRYRTIGADESGKLKRFGIEAHALRGEASRFAEWFRLSLRHGWLMNPARVKETKLALIVRRGTRALNSMMKSRDRRGLSLPYGPQAHRLGWALTPEIPPPRPLKE